MEQLAQSLQRLKPAPMRRVWRQLLGDLASLLAGVRQCVMLDYVLLTPAQVRRTSRVRRALPPPSPRGLYVLSQRTPLSAPLRGTRQSP